MSRSTKPLTRREFLKVSSELTLSASVASLLYTENSFAGFDLLRSEMSFSVLQGVTSDTMTQLSVDVPVGMKVNFRLVAASTGQVFSSELHKVSGFPGEPFEIYHIGFTGLNPYEVYYFHILDSENAVLDERELQTLDLSIEKPRIAFISCTRDSVKSKKAWQSVYDSNPHMLVLMGDNIYGDLFMKAGPTTLWRRFTEGRQKISFYHRKKLIPTVSTWDDHDFGKNNENGEYKHKENSLRNYEAFFPQSEIPGVYSKGPGLAATYRGFGLQFLMLDDRYFRSDKREENGGTLGDEQKEWALNALKEFPGVTWIVHGSVVFGKSLGGESWENQFKPDLHHFLDGVKETGRKVLFASGDVHHTETMTVESDYLGYESLELISSGLHTRVYPFKGKNKRRRHISTKKGFALVEHTFHDDRLNLSIDSIGNKGKVYFHDDFQLDLA